MLTDKEFEKERRDIALGEISRTAEHLQFQLESMKCSLGHMMYFCDQFKLLVESLEKSAKEQEIPAA